MLVLKRSVKDSVIISLPDGRTISIVVNDIGNGQTVLGFDAPQDVRVYRTEVMERPDFVLPTAPKQ